MKEGHRCTIITHDEFQEWVEGEFDGDRLGSSTLPNPRPPFALASQATASASGRQAATLRHS